MKPQFLVIVGGTLKERLDATEQSSIPSLRINGFPRSPFSVRQFKHKAVYSKIAVADFNSLFKDLPFLLRVGSVKFIPLPEFKEQYGRI